MIAFVAPLTGRVDRNLISRLLGLLFLVAPRKGRVDRNTNLDARMIAVRAVAPRKGRVDRNLLL